MMSILQLRWPRLPVAALKLHAFSRVLSFGDSAGALKECPETSEVLRRFLSASELHGPDPRSEWYQGTAHAGAVDVPLQEYFNTVGGTLSRLYLNPSRLGSLAAQTLAALRACAEQRICETCSPPPAHPCAWVEASQRQDLSTLQERGECLLPLRALFSAVVSAAERAYEGCASRPIRPVSLCTLPSLKRNDYLDLGIDGLTVDVPMGGREVQLQIEAGSFGLGDYLALPYLLVHEIVAHGFCGLDVGDESSTLSVSFHDGWMDWASTQVLLKLLGAPELHAHPVDDFRVVSERVRAYRCNADDPEAPRETIEILAGIRAVQVVGWLMAQVLDSHRDSRSDDPAQISELVLRLSLSINANPAIGHNQRGNLVAQLNHLYSRSNNEARVRALARRPQVLPLVQAFIEREDPIAFVEGVLAL